MALLINPARPLGLCNRRSTSVGVPTHWSYAIDLAARFPATSAAFAPSRMSKNVASIISLIVPVPLDQPLGRAHRVKSAQRVWRVPHLGVIFTECGVSHTSDGG